MIGNGKVFGLAAGVAFAAGAMTSGEAAAAVLAEYTFGTTAGSTLASSDTDTGSVATDFAAGAGYADNTIDNISGADGGGDLGLRIYGAGVDGNTAAENSTAGEYFTFTVAATNGNKINLDAFSVTKSRSSSSPAFLTVFAIADGGDPITVLNSASFGTGWSVSGPIDLSGDARLQDVSSVEFRIVFHGHNQGAGINYVDNVLLEGTTVIPEPASLALLGVGATLVCPRRRRA